MQTQVFSKPAGSQISITLDFSLDLAAGETISAASLVSVSPTTSVALAVVVLSFSASQVVLQVGGGHETVTYGVKIQLDTNLGNTYFPVAAVLVATEDFAPFVSSNPAAFQTLVDELPAGEAAVGNAFFVLPPGQNTTGAYVLWSLLDSESRGYSSGNAYDLKVSPSSFSTTVSASAVVHSPSNIPPSLDTQKYQIRWELHVPGNDPVFLFEALRILGISSVPVGAPDVVELQGDTATLSIVSPEGFDSIEVTVYQQNTPVNTSGRLLNPKRTASGWYYEYNLATSSLTSQLEAYTVSWKCTQSQSSIQQATRITSALYIYNPSILTAIETVRQTVEKARSTLLGFQDTLFEPSTVANALIRGRDMFNAAGGVLTSFTMTNATGGVREFWLRYSEISLLRAQALAEGEKAFDFQGQSISLSVNKAEYYNQLADSLQSSVDNEVGPYKKALKSAGVDTGGNGDISGAVSRNIPRVGISVHPASQFGAYYRFNRF